MSRRTSGPLALEFGYNPMQQLPGPLLSHLPASNAAYVAGREFFPHLITAPFHDRLGVAFGFAIAANVIAVIASALTGRRTQAPAAPESLGYELAAEGGFEPSELVLPARRKNVPNRPTSRAKRTRTAVSLPGFPDPGYTTCPRVRGRVTSPLDRLRG